VGFQPGDRVAALKSTSRLVQFGLVGGIGLLVDNAILFGLVEQVGLRPVAAAVVSKELAILVMFLLNERWTFTAADRDGHPVRRLVRSNLARLGGLVVGVGVLSILVRVGVWYLLANLVGIGFGFFLNYVTETLYTWRLHERT